MSKLKQLKKGMLIVTDGTDGSGKQTQTDLLYKRLLSKGYKVKKVDYPNYESASSSLVKMYLNGEFGKNAEDVDPYVASTFYAVDRYASYKTGWEEFYKSGGIIIADRYTTSNMLHQACKMSTKEEIDKYLNWLEDLEYGMYGIPKPDLVFYLDMPLEYSVKLMEDRLNKINGGDKKDIHEGNTEYLTKAKETSNYLIDKYGWLKIDCVKEDKLRGIEDINTDMVELVKEFIDRCINE